MSRASLLAFRGLPVCRRTDLACNFLWSLGWQHLSPDPLARVGCGGGAGLRTSLLQANPLRAPNNPKGPKSLSLECRRARGEDLYFRKSFPNSINLTPSLGVKRESVLK